VVFEQAVCVGVCNWSDVPGVKIHEVRVVAFFQKEVLAIVAAIVDMVVEALLERRGCVLSLILQEELKRGAETCPVSLDAGRILGWRETGQVFLGGRRGWRGRCRRRGWLPSWSR
jgi:hypothetical protein